MAPPPPASSDAPDSSSVVQIALALLSAAGAGIGGLGVVTAVGGIVTEARFRGAGLPSELSVSVESRSYLLAMGGNVLALSGLAALVLVGLIHWLPRPLDRDAAPWKWLLGDRSFRHRWCIFGGWTAVLTVLDYYLGWGRSALLQYWSQRFMFAGVIVVALAGSAAATVLARHARSSEKPLDEALRLAGLFGVLVLLSGTVATAGSLNYPSVRPAAVLLLDKPPLVLCGIYVGQTSDRVYIGEAFQRGGKSTSVLGDHNMGQVIELRRADVGRLVIGGYQPLPEALSAKQEQRFEEQVTVPGTAPPQNC